MPYYLCPVMRITAVKAGCRVRFYHIDNNFYPTVDFPEDTYVLYPNYFGVCSENVGKLSKKYKNLIVDNAHSFFSTPCGIASFNSVRKFFPEIRDGAFLYIKSACDTIYKQSDYKYDLHEMSEQEFLLNEKRLDCEEIMLMSESSKKYLSRIDLEFVKRLYRQKFDKSVNTYIDTNLLKFNIAKNDVPYKYPLLTDNTYIADGIAKKYIDEGYKIYRYWENLPADFPEKIFRDNLVAI